MNIKNIYIISAIIFFLGFIAGGVTFSALTVFRSSPSTDGTGIACPEDAKLCPDGSGVGRTGPNCEFAECPIYFGGGNVDEIIEPTPGNGDNMPCTADAKLCPDGSAVGRVGPNCEFAECPPTDGGQGTACKSDSDCSPGYVCLDPSPVIREGESNLRCWKKGMPTPICLSGDTRIGMPNGDLLVRDVRKGMKVWTINTNGQKMESVILLAGKTRAPVGHKVVHIKLSDSRELYASFGHKVADGRKAGDLVVGDILQGATVLSANFIPYTEEYTYDILPDGDTGMYFANGILLQSTLRVP
jgi:hypothetical protein